MIIIAFFEGPDPDTVGIAVILLAVLILVFAKWIIDFKYRNKK